MAASQSEAGDPRSGGGFGEVREQQQRRNNGQDAGSVHGISLVAHEFSVRELVPPNGVAQGRRLGVYDDESGQRREPAVGFAHARAGSSRVSVTSHLPAPRSGRVPDWLELATDALLDSGGRDSACPSRSHLQKEG